VPAVNDTALLYLAGVSVAGHLDDITLKLQHGARHAVVASPESGTLLLRLIYGITYPTHGDIWIDGRRLTGRWTAIRRIVQYLPSTPSLPAARTVRGALASAGGWRRRPRPERVADLLDLTGLAWYADDDPRGLPPGAWRLLDLAVALTRQPKLILVDRATNGLAGYLDQFHTLLTQMPDVAVLSTVATTHDAHQLADSVTVIDRGQIID